MGTWIATRRDAFFYIWHTAAEQNSSNFFLTYFRLSTTPISSTRKGPSLISPRSIGLQTEWRVHRGRPTGRWARTAASASSPWTVSASERGSLSSLDSSSLLSHRGEDGRDVRRLRRRHRVDCPKRRPRDAMEGHYRCWIRYGGEMEAGVPVSAAKSRPACPGTNPDSRFRNGARPTWMPSVPTSPPFLDHY